MGVTFKVALAYYRFVLDAFESGAKVFDDITSVIFQEIKLFKVAAKKASRSVITVSESLSKIYFPSSLKYMFDFMSYDIFCLLNNLINACVCPQCHGIV